MKLLAQRQPMKEEELLLQAESLAQRQAMEEEELLQAKSLAQRQPLEEEELLQAKPLAQRQPLEEEELLQAKPLAQRQPMEEAELLQAKSLAQRQVPLEGGEMEPEVERSVQQAQRRGQPLPEDLRSSMEGAFGADFSDVRVNTGIEADALNNSMGARAFTTGQDIFSRQGEYDPSSRSGQDLLAHELTHVVQQGVAPIQRIFLEPILSMTYPEIKEQLELTYDKVPGWPIIRELAQGEGQYSTLEQVAKALNLQPKAQGVGVQPQPVQVPAPVVNEPEPPQADEPEKEETLQGKPLQKSKPVELMERSGRDWDDFATAVVEVEDMGENLEAKAADYTKPTRWQKLLGAKEWDYGWASVKVGDLGKVLRQADQMLSAARKLQDELLKADAQVRDDHDADKKVIAAGEPNAVWPMAANAIDATASQLEGKVEDYYPKKLKVYSKIIASGVAAAVKTSIESGTLLPAELVKGERLGKGGGGEVWEYSYLQMNQKIAGKETLVPETSESRKALKTEPDLMRDLPESRSLLSGLGAVEKGKTIAFMELAGKVDVKGVIEEMNNPEHGLGPDEKALIMRYILKGTLEGLEALHKFGMVHGDVKPGNIFLDEKLNPVLADFGESHMQGMGTGGVGTKKYMAPEVVEEHGSFRASDMWAVGEMLLLALTGRNSIRYILDTDDPEVLKNEEYMKGDFTDEQLAAKLDKDHSESGITEAITSFAKGALTQDQGERMTATQGLAHHLLEDVDDEGAKGLIRQLLEAIAEHKAEEAEA